MSGSDLCIPRNEIVRPRHFKNRIIIFCLPISIFMYLWVIYYSHNRGTQDRSWNIKIAHRYMNVEIGNKAAQFLFWIYMFQILLQCMALSKFSKDISKSFITKMSSPEISKIIFYSFLKNIFMNARL
jgi:hypothetical protein